MALLLMLGIVAAWVLIILTVHWTVEWWEDRRDRRRFCQKPGRGWYCTYAEGHLGECDAWPEWWMTLWVKLNWRTR